MSKKSDRDTPSAGKKHSPPKQFVQQHPQRHGQSGGGGTGHYKAIAGDIRSSGSSQEKVSRRGAAAAAGPAKPAEYMYSVDPDGSPAFTPPQEVNRNKNREGLGRKQRCEPRPPAVVATKAAKKQSGSTGTEGGGRMYQSQTTLNSGGSEGRIPSVLLTPNQQRRLIHLREDQTRQEKKRRNKTPSTDSGPLSPRSPSKRSGRTIERRIEHRMDIHSYCHGFILFRMVGDLLSEPNRFVVHKSYTNVSEPEPILSVLDSGRKLRHIIIKATDDGKFWIEPSRPFENIQSLVRYYFNEKQKVPGGGLGGTIAHLEIPLSAREWEIDPDYLPMYSQHVAGEGAFGFVNVVRMVGDDTYVRQVAVKYGGKGRTQEEDIMEEARMIIKSQGEWVLEVIGVVTLRAPIKIVMEFSQFGDLRKYLMKKHSSLTPTQVIKFCVDTARGLNHVADLGLIHRDIAARNYIVKQDQGNLEMYRCVLADFGLCREGPLYKGEEGDKVSIRWAAPEQYPPGSLSYSGSDAWALAITFAEIFSDNPGSEPYAKLRNEEAITAMTYPEQYDHLLKDIPPRTPPKIGEVMKRCWKLKPEERPKFKTIICDIKPLLPSNLR